MTVSSGSVVNMSGGMVGDRVSVLQDSAFNISGGSVGEQFWISPGGTANISGGTFGPWFGALRGSTVNLFGRSFLLNGQPVDDLALNETRMIDVRDVNLSGILTDGSPFSFDLNTITNQSPPRREDGFDVTAQVTITRIPEPRCLAALFTAALCALLGRLRMAADA